MIRDHAAVAPHFETARLTLRPMSMADFPRYRDFLASPRAKWMGGPHDAGRAWDWFCNDVAQWALEGHGGLIVSLKGRAIGQVAVCHGPNFPEPELGWFLFDAADEGQGYAAEAAAVMRDWAFQTRGVATLVSYVDPDNHASRRLAERLGGALDPDAATPAGMACLTYRYTPSRREDDR